MSGTDKATGRPWSVDHGIGSNDPIILLCGDKAMGELRSASAGIAVASLLSERDALAARVARLESGLCDILIAFDNGPDILDAEGFKHRGVCRTMAERARAALSGGKGGAA